jgi:hypothetical protein
MIPGLYSSRSGVGAAVGPVSVPGGARLSTCPPGMLLYWDGECRPFPNQSPADYLGEAVRNLAAARQFLSSGAQGDNYNNAALQAISAISNSWLVCKLINCTGSIDVSYPLAFMRGKLAITAFAMVQSAANAVAIASQAVSQMGATSANTLPSGHRFVQGVPDGFGAASDDLSAFNNAISAGDQYLASGVTDDNALEEFTSAVQVFQAGASAAVTSLGPAIDAQTGGASRPLTSQAAAVFNAQLSGLANTGSSQQDAINASLYAHQMQALYTTAIAMPAPGPTTPSPPPLTARPPPATLAPTPTAAAESGSVWPWLIGGAAIAVAGLWYLRSSGIHKRYQVPRLLRVRSR